MKQISYLLLLLCLISAGSCKKNIDDIEEEIKPPTKVTADIFNVTAFEVVTLRSTEDISRDYSATFGDKELQIKKTNDSTLSFVVPDLASGDHLLKFELGHLSFKVTAAKPVDVEKVSADLEKELKSYILIANADTSLSNDEQKNIKSDIDTLVAKFKALPNAMKRENLLFLQANKKIFDKVRENAKFLDSESANLRGTTTSCTDRTNSVIFNTCHAQNLATMANDLIDPFAKLEKYYSWNNQFVVGAFLVTYGAWMPIQTFRIYLDLYLRKQWVLDDDLFKGLPTEYKDYEFKHLNLNANMRSLWPNKSADDVLLYRTKFFEFVHILGSYWRVYEATIGRFPQYRILRTPLELETENVKISELSPRVELWDQKGEMVQFRSINGTSEDFDFILTVMKDGFEIKNKHYARIIVEPNYKIEYVSGDKQTFQGGMPYPLVYKIIDTKSEKYIQNVVEASNKGLTVRAKTTFGQVDSGLIHSSGTCNECFSVNSNMENHGPATIAKITIELYYKNKLVDTYESTQMITPYGG